MTNIEVKFFRNSFTTANASWKRGDRFTAQAQTLSAHSGECFRIRNKTIHKEQIIFEQSPDRSEHCAAFYQVYMFRHYVNEITAFVVGMG